MSKPTPIRVGVLGAARIVNKVWEAIDRAGGQITIIGCRDPSRGASFVDEIQAKLGETQKPRVGSYEDVINATDVDVVYIPIPVTTRDDWVKACAKAGKHVVGEKPPARSSEELREWLDLLGKKNLLYMDGTMFTHGTRLGKVKEAISALGPIRHIDAQITFQGGEDFMKNDIRIKQELEPYGALGDVGWYCIRWILHVMDFRLPDKVASKVVKATEAGAITALEAQFKYNIEKGEEITAKLYCSFTDVRLQCIRIYCTNGVVTVPNCVNLPPEGRPFFKVEKTAWKPEAPVPTQVDDEGGEVVYAGEEEEDYHYQMDQMWRNVSTILKKTGTSSLTADPQAVKMYGDYAYKTQKLMDKVAEAARQRC